MAFALRLEITDRDHDFRISPRDGGEQEQGAKASEEGGVHGWRDIGSQRGNQGRGSPLHALNSKTRNEASTNATNPHELRSLRKRRTSSLFGSTISYCNFFCSCP